MRRVKLSARILVVAPKIRGTLTGLGLAVQLMLSGLQERKISYRHISTNFLGMSINAGNFSISKVIESIYAVFAALICLSFVKVVYITMSTSILGFIRECVIVVGAKACRKRVVLHLHGGGFESFYKSQNLVSRKLIRSHLVRADSIIVLGNLLKNQFECIGNIVTEKLEIVPNGLPLGIKDPGKTQKSIRESETVNLLYCSSLMPSKGYLDVVQAVKLLNEICPNRYHLNLCGEFVNAKTEGNTAYSTKVQLLEYFYSEGISNYISYHGQVSGQLKEKCFKESHIFILPTNYEWEGQPLSIIEAGAWSLPIISCYHKGIPEQVYAGENGEFVEFNNPQDIVKAVQKISDSSETYNRYANASRTHFEKHFKQETHFKKLCLAILGGQNEG